MSRLDFLDFEISEKCDRLGTGARKGVLETVAAVRTRRRHVSYLVTGPGSRHGLGAQPGT